MSLKTGDRVAWSHSAATPHADGSIVRESAILSVDAHAQFGVVEDSEGQPPNWHRVKLDDGTDSLVLTADELVQIGEED